MSLLFNKKVIAHLKVSDGFQVSRTRSAKVKAEICMLNDTFISNFNSAALKNKDKGQDVKAKVTQCPAEIYKQNCFLIGLGIGLPEEHQRSNLNSLRLK